MCSENYLKKENIRSYVTILSHSIAMRQLVLTGLIGLLFYQVLHAEGTRQVAPAPSDIAMLLTSRVDFSNFAAFNGPADSRLFITVNSASETIFLGLSGEYDDFGNPFTDRLLSQYRFRIKRFTGTGNDPVVHGPFTIDHTTANVQSWTDAQFGEYLDTLTINGVRVFSFTPGQAGDYYIEFQDVGNDRNPKVLIGYWDITVAENGVQKNGRVWSRNWAFRTPVEDGTVQPDCSWDRKFNGTLFSYTTDGFVSKIDFKNSGFQGLAFTVAFNSTGPGNTGDPSLDRMSIEGENATDNSAEHQIFLNEPDPLVFPDGECGSVTAASNFLCTGDGGFCLPVTATRPGQVEVILDFNQDGDFDPEGEDVSLLFCFEEDNLSGCVPWDGLKGDGSPVEFGDTVDILLVYTQGIQHWAVYDAEFLKEGFCVEAVRPLCGAGSGLISGALFWDDRNIIPEPGTNQPKDGRNGCLCGTEGCRTWTNFDPNTPCDRLNDGLTTGYGDKSTLNTWWFANTRIEAKADIPLFTCQIAGRDTICAGEETEFFAETSAPNIIRFEWSGPGGFTGTESSTGPISTPGEYALTITDNTGCQTFCSRTLVVNEALTLNPVGVISASCETASDGVINVSATGGSSPYLYSIDNLTFQPTPTFPGLSPGTYTVWVTDRFDCIDSLQVTVDFESLPQINYPERLTICAGESVQAPPSGPSNLFYEWSPTTGIDDPTSPTPVFSPAVTTTYIVAASKTASRVCTTFDTVVVEVIPELGLTISGNTVTCDGEITLNAESSAPATFTWLNAAGNVIGAGPELNLPVEGNTVIILRAAAENGCVTTREIPVTDATIDVSIPDQVAACLGEELRIDVVNNNPGNLSYRWTPAEAFVPGTANTANPVLTQEVGERTVYVSIFNVQGCTYSDSVKTILVDPNFELGFTSMVQCNGATVEFTNTSTNAIGYFWNFGDPNNPNSTSTAENPTYTYPEPGLYTVTLTIQYDVSCSKTVSQEILITNPDVIADFNYELTDCSVDGGTIALTDASQNDFNNTESWNWVFSNGETSTLQNPTITLAESTILGVELTITTANDCQSTTRDTIEFVFPELNLQENVQLCPGDSVTLNPGGDPDLEYIWSPAEGLSDPGAASPVARPLQTTTYTVMVRGAGDVTCEISGQVVVTVVPEIELTVSDDQVTCGEDAILSASANVPVTFEWRNSRGALVGTGSPITVNPFREETYTVKATDENGCVAIDSIKVFDQGVNVEVNAPTEDVIGCGPQEIAVEVENLDPLDTLIFDWKPAGQVSDPTIPNPVVRVSSGTVTFSTIIENQFGCTDSVSFTVTAIDFDPGLPDTVIVCAGENKALSPGADPTRQYQWSPAEGLDDPTSSNPLFTGTESTTYFVTVMGNVGGIMCEKVDTVEVIVLPPINLETTNDTTLCIQQELTLSASSSQNEIIFTWFDAPSLENKIGEGPQITLVPPVGTMLYYVLAEDAEGCTELGTVEVTTLRTPETISESITVCADTPTPINPDGDPTLQYQWSPTTGLDLSEPWNPVVTIDTDITYQVTVTVPSSGCEYTGEVKVKVNPLLNLTLSPDTSLCEPSQITLRANTDVPASVKWFDNPAFSGTPVSSSRNYTFTPPTGTTTLYVIAEDGIACADTASVTVEVLENTDPVELQLTPDQVTLCEPEPVTIEATTGGQATVSWFNNPDLSGEPVFVGNSYSFVPPVGTTLLYVLAEGLAECTNSDTATATVIVLDPFQGIMLPEGPILGCPGDTVGLDLDPSLEYAWSPTTNIDLTDPNRPVFLIGDPIGYTLEVTDPVTGCTKDLSIDAGPYPLPGLSLNRQIDTVLCSPGLVNLEASTDLPATINWFDSDDFSQPPIGTGNKFSIEIRNDTTITFYAQAVSEEGCTEADSITISVKDLIDESGIGDLPDTTLTVCAGAPTTLPLNGDFEYQWDPTEGVDLSDPANPVFTVNEDRDYAVTVTDPASGCVDSTILKVRVYPLINLVVSPGDTICIEQEIILSASADQEVSFEWSDNQDFDPVLQTGAEFSVVPPVGSTTYFVRATDANGCVAVGSAQVGFFPIDAALPPVIKCEPADELTLEVVNNAPDQNLEYLWFPEEAILSDPMAGPGAVVNPNIATEFSVDLINQFGCTATLTTTAKVISLSDSLDISADPDTLLPNESSQLEVTGCRDCIYNWSPAGSLDRNDIANPVATPASTTEYNVIVEQEGCRDTLNITVVVEEFECGYPYVYLPNAFTPNGDGINDVLYIRGRNLTRVKLIIFNRWGQKVFETEAQDQGWDGTYQGQQLPPDVYGFYMEVQCGDGEVYQSQGNVTLLR